MALMVWRLHRLFRLYCERVNVTNIEVLRVCLLNSAACGRVCQMHGFTSGFDEFH